MPVRLQGVARFIDLVQRPGRMLKFSAISMVQEASNSWVGNPNQALYGISTGTVCHRNVRALDAFLVNHGYARYADVDVADLARISFPVPNYTLRRTARPGLGWAACSASVPTLGVGDPVY